jgi:hypothetical protein
MLLRKNDDGCHQLVANSIERIAKADGKKDRAIFRDTKVRGPVVALVAPL